MNEIEAKIIEIDRPRVEARLRELGAVKTFDGELSAYFYDFPDERISQAQGVLRLRREGDEVRLTGKRMVSLEGGVKDMAEDESVVADLAAVQRILLGLGLVEIKQTRKYRTQYELGDVHVVFDDYQGRLAAIPVFIEIEAQDRVRLFEVVAQLGFTPADCKSWSTYELVQHYGLE